MPFRYDCQGENRNMPEFNWKAIATNVAEAREQLENIEEVLKAGTPPTEVEFEIMLRHAYHHLNFAWNVRRQPMTRCSNLTDADFKEWGRFPPGFDALDTLSEQ
jgi:hypothetical protein